MPLSSADPVVLFNERTRLPVLLPLAPASLVIEGFPPEFAMVAARVGASAAAVASELP